MIIPLGQGLELTEDKLRVPPGTLSDCLNYEIAYSSGYRRIDGFLRYDGRVESEDMTQYRNAVQPVPNGAYGIHFFPDWANDESVLYAVTESTRFEIENRGWFNPSVVGMKGQRAELHNGTPTGFPNTWILEPVANFGFDDKDYIEVLTTSDLSTGTLTAYTRVEIVNGQNVPDPGDRIVSDTAAWGAYVRGVEVISGAGVDGNLKMDLWVEEGNGSSISLGQEIQLEVDGTRIGDLERITGWSTTGATGTGLDPQIGDVVARVGDPLDGNNGVLLRTTGSSWEPLEPAYEARFINGAVEPANLYIGTESTTTSPAEDYLPKAAITRPDRLAALGGITQKDWIPSAGTLADVLQADDGTYAESTLDADSEITDVLEASDFGITVDPLDEVTGLSVEVVAENTGTTDITFRNVTVLQSRGRGDVVAAKATHTFGSATDQWGLGSGSELADAIQSSSFSVKIHFNTANGTYPTSVRVHSIRVIVHKRGSDVSSKVYLRSGGTDYQARVLYTYTRDGAWADGDAEGIITLARLQNPSEVPENAEIRSEAGGGGALLARLDGNLSPVRLPSRQRLEEKNSRFQFINTNFFAAGRLTAVYGVSGAGPAFTFNSEYLFRIYTGRSEDEPRHVARHADRLALGFENGDADFSVTGRPDLFKGELDAFTLGFGQRITGMLPLTGGAAGVWTEDATHIVKGSAVEQIQQQIISPTSGAIEYTVVDMGIPVFCDYRGVNTLVASQRFGDFDMGRLSAPIRSWILPRLQSLRSDGQSRPVLAHPVQKKNQYRLWFADGQILTMTFLDDQQAKFTFQQYTVPTESGSLTAKIQAVTTGLDRELSSVGFAIFDGSDYVYRLDHTATFDGDVIPANMTINPLHITGPGKYQRLNVLHFHGLSDGEFDLTTQIGVSYEPPSGHRSTVTMTEGSPTFAKVRHKARGRDFAVRFETYTETPHTLQIIELPDISPRRLER